MTLLIRDLKPALANVLGTIKNVTNLPFLEAAKITVGDGKIKFLATDRFVAIEHEIAYNTDAEFSYILDAESLQLLAKLPPSQGVEFTPLGVVTKNIKFTPADLDFPSPVIDLIDNAWKDEWLKDEEQGVKSRNAGIVTGYKPSLVKHIKDVVIIPQPYGGQKARLRAPGLRGVLMGTRERLGELND